MHQGVIMTEDLYAHAGGLGRAHYRDRLEPKDLADPQLARECMAALEDLERILGLAGAVRFGVTTSLTRCICGVF
jgi:succinylarginine dihydrolase